MGKLEENLTEWKKIEAQIVARALMDEAFRTRLEQDPLETIETELHCKVAGGMKFQVKEEDEPGVMTIMLPKTPEHEVSEKLSDQEIDSVVAAGNIGISVGCITTDIVLVKAIV